MGTQGGPEGDQGKAAAARLGLWFRMGRAKSGVTRNPTAPPASAPGTSSPHIAQCGGIGKGRRHPVGLRPRQRQGQRGTMRKGNPNCHPHQKELGGDERPRQRRRSRTGRADTVCPAERPLPREREDAPPPATRERAVTNPSGADLRTSLNHPIDSSDGRCVPIHL